MAEITQPLPASEPPKGIGYSEGIGTNKQWSTLFGGIAEVGGAAIKAADAAIQQNIYEDATGSVDQTRALFGVDAATPESHKGALPPDLAKGQQLLGRLEKGRQAGTVRDSHYFGQLNAIVKGLKSKYPGYGPEIDGIVQNITGVTPANALLKSLSQEADDEGRAIDKAKDDRRQFEERYGDSITLWKPDYFETAENERPDLDAVKKGVFDVEARKSWVASENAELELRNKKGTLAKEDVLQTARRRMVDMASTGLQGALRTEGMGGGDWDKLRTKIQDAQSGKVKMSPKDKEEVVLMANDLKLKVAESANRELLSMPGVEKLSQTERQDVLNIANSQIDNMMDAIINEKYGVLQADAMWLKATEDRTNRELLERGGHEVATIMSLSKILGPAAFDLWMQHGGAESMDAFTQAVLKSMRAESVVQDGNVNDDMDETDRLLDMKKVDPRMPRALIEGQLGDIMNPEASPVVAQKSIEYLFGNKGGLDLSKFPQEQWIDVYTTLTNPKVTERVFSLAGDNVDLRENYTAWVYGKFFQVFDRAAADLTIPPELSGFIVPEFNPSTSQFELESPITNLPDWMPPEMLRQYQSMFAQRYKKYNAALRSVVGVMDQEGVDPVSTLMPFLNSKGIATPVPGANSTGGPDDRVPQQDVLDLASGERDPRADVIQDIADARGIDPVDLATAMLYETKGTLDPGIRGGENDDYIGLIQFGPTEQRDFGADQGQDFATQMQAVNRFLEGRKLPPGADLLDIYSTILAGSPGLYDRKDKNGSVRQHVSRMKNSRFRKMAEELMKSGT